MKNVKIIKIIEKLYICHICRYEHILHWMHQKEIWRARFAMSRNSAYILWKILRKDIFQFNFISIFCGVLRKDMEIYEVYPVFAVDKNETYFKHWMKWNSNLQTVLPLAWIYRQFLLKLSLIKSNPLKQSNSETQFN